ncbi:MAG: DNA alkylation repair protein [Ruminococcaceae bacterium]|nr:DNA alkylation repair protein [Oscillospiraceae bacterium]
MSIGNNKIRESLFALSDLTYRDFSSSLIPTVDKEKVIGVRTPLLRKLTNELYGSYAASEFMLQLPHKYYEENNLHAFLIEKNKDFSECISCIEKFLPYVDNWATCDSMNPKIFSENLDELINYAYKWIDSQHTYTIRYGIGVLMRYFLDDKFTTEYPDKVASVKSSEYYVNMMVAWYFATALAKQYSFILPYFEFPRLNKWTHNKAIQKACESFRITDSQKQYLKKLKIKY